MKIRLLITAVIITTGFSSALKAEQSLQRLFYSPAERASIDSRRQGVKKSVEPEQRTQRIQVKGYLKRNGQPDVIWVNQGNTLKSRRPVDDVKVVQVKPSGAVRMRIKGQGTVNAKPGQYFSRPQSKVLEVYESGKEAKAD